MMRATSRFNLAVFEVGSDSTAQELAVICWTAFQTLESWRTTCCLVRGRLCCAQQHADLGRALCPAMDGDKYIATCGLCARATDSLWPFMPDFHIAFFVKTIITRGRFGKVKATCLMHFSIQFGELQQAPCNFSQNPHYNWYLWHFVTLDSWYSSFQSMDVHHCPSPSVD